MFAPNEFLLGKEAVTSRKRMHYHVIREMPGPKTE